MGSGNVTPRNRSSLRHPDGACPERSRRAPAAGLLAPPSGLRSSVRASAASRCPNPQSLLFIHASHVPVRALPVDASEGAVFQYDVVFVARDRPFNAFGDAP